MKTTQVAVDLAKSVFEIAVSHEVGRVAEHRRFNRSGLRRFLEKQEPSEILMEACGTAHYWSRECQAMSHRVRLLPAGDVRRYRDGDKTDRTDTKALLEASRNDAIDIVPVKSEDQQAMAAMHRIRSGFLQTRPPSRSPTSSPGSPGESGPTNDPSTLAPLPERLRHQIPDHDTHEHPEEAPIHERR